MSVLYVEKWILGDLLICIYLGILQRSKASAVQPAPELVEVFVDGRPISVIAGSTVLQVGIVAAMTVVGCNCCPLASSKYSLICRSDN